MKTISIRTHRRSEMIDITRYVQEYVSGSGVSSGMVLVFVPHTTAGVSINENADPDVVRDVQFAMERTVPNTGFMHVEGNSDAHTKAQLTGFSLNVIIESGRLVLGTWQSLYFCEYDGPRQRQVCLKIINSVDEPNSDF